VQHEAGPGVGQVVAVVHPDARVAGRNISTYVSPGRTWSVSVHHGLPVAGTPSRATTSQWWPCRCMGWSAVDRLTMVVRTSSPVRTVKTGPSGHTRPFIDHW
jgi:hypothetical protein